MQTSSQTELTYFRGRVALYWLLKALGIGAGDEIATQAFTCLAVPEAILATGARPLYIDLEQDGYNLDFQDLAAKISPNTRAIVVQHTFGIPARLEQILDVANKAGLPVIEDCCHTHCSTYQNRTVGTFGVASFHSFEWGKPVAVGIGGSASINDRGLEQRVREMRGLLRTPGRASQLKLRLQASVFRLLYRPRFYWTMRNVFHRLTRLGISRGNYNPVADHGEAVDDFELEMVPIFQRRLQRQLMQVESHARHSSRLAQQYRDAISTSVAAHADLQANCRTVFARYPLRVANKQELLERARRANVELAGWYSTPIHPLDPIDSTKVSYEPGSCPQAEQRAEETVSLPTHPRVTQHYVDNVTKFFREAA